MKIIKLTKEKFTLLDDEDFDEINKFKWQATKTGYATRNTKGKTIRIHRLVMNAPKGMMVDHIDHNTLNNQKSNLRICTHTQNQQNQKNRQHGRGSSKYKGVVVWVCVHEKMTKKGLKPFSILLIPLPLNAL